MRGDRQRLIRLKGTLPFVVLTLVMLVLASACATEDTPPEPKQPRAIAPTEHQASSREPPGPPPEQDAGTRRMVDTLQHIYADALANPRPFFNLNKRRAAMLREVLASPGTEEPDLRLLYVDELLYAGEPLAAINQLDGILRQRGWSGNATTPETRPLVDKLALAYLRLGEQQNCLDHPGPEACILPLAGQGVHRNREGSRRASALYKTLLRQHPGDYQARWLLNITAQTLGTYPQAVPEPWRIDGLRGSSPPLIPRFPNRAVDLNVAVSGISGGVSVEDFDNDGWLDLFVTSYGLNDQVGFFLNDGAGGFVDRTASAGLLGIVGGLNVIHADYDNDGWTDLLILRGAWLGEHGTHPNSLLRNNGDGTFSDVTFAAGLASNHPTQTAAWADVNLDGLLDLFVGNEYRSSMQSGGVFYSWEPGAPHPSELYFNNGDGTFTEAAARVGLDVNAFVKGCSWGDVNRDGLPDLYVSLLGERNRLYLNRGGTSPDDWRFEEQEAGVSEPLQSFPVWFWDYDQDGWDDLLALAYDIRKLDQAGRDVAREYLGLSTLTEKPRLYHNNRDGTFTDATRTAGLQETVLYAMGSNYGDLNNDGYPDLYVGTGSPDLRAVIPNRMFLNEAGTTFRDVTFDGGFGHLQKGHGVAFADFDRDGDQDVYAVMGGAVEGDVASNVLFENPNPSPENAWIVLELEGRTANRSAIGARIRLAVTGADGTHRAVFATVSTGGSFGASSLQQEIGLGRAERIDTLAVTWPTRQRTTDTYVDLPVRQHLRITEGDARPTVLDRPPVPFRTSPALQH